MKIFTMSQFASHEDLLKAKLKHAENIADNAMCRLADLGQVQQDDDGEWIWSNNGGYVYDGM